MNQVRGNTIVWNQLVQIPTSSQSRTFNDVVITDNRDGSYTFSGTANGTDFISINTVVDFIDGHYYYLYAGENSQLNIIIASSHTAAFNSEPNGKIVKCIYTETQSIQIRVINGVVYNDTIFPMVIDLTQMFGSAASSMTVSQVKSMFPYKNYPYNAGQLISCGPTAVVSTGFNLWDEEWETGIYNAQGEKQSYPGYIRSTNKVSVLPGNAYYLKKPSNAVVIYFYDANGTMVGNTEGNVTTFTTPSNAYYLVFYLSATTYNHDICINLSDPSRNGTYLPYQKDELDLSWISELTYNDGTQDVQMFPNGLCSAGTVYDEVTPTKAIKRVGAVDLGECTIRAYQTGVRATFTPTGMKAFVSRYPYTTGALLSTSKYIPDTGDDNYDCWVGGIAEGELIIYDTNFTNETTIRSTVNGIMCYYELATPIEIPLTHNMGYAVQPGGTEQLLPENHPRTTPVTSQIIIDVTYPLDSVGTLQNLKRNYMSEATLTSLITALNAINTNMSWKASRAADGSLIIAAN